MDAIGQLMLGIEAALDAIEGLRTSDFKPEQINPPHAIVGVPPVEDYTEAFTRGGKYTLNPTITVLTSKMLDRVGQRQLASYAGLTGESSIPAAIVADRTLGGVCEDCQVLSFRPLQNQEVGLVGYYGGVFVLRAMVDERLLT